MEPQGKLPKHDVFPYFFKIVYLFPTQLPIAQSHGVQSLNTCAALAKLGAHVELVVAKLNGTPESVLAHYNIPPHPNLKIRQFAHKGSKLNRWSGRGFRMALRTFALRRALSLGTVFYVRGTATALETILALAPVTKLLRKPLLYEVHGIQYLDLRQNHGGRYGEGADLERYIESRHELERRAYSRLTGMICISTRLRELMAEQFDIRIPALIAPSGVHPSMELPPPLTDREYDVAYVGGLYAFNGIDLLLDALAQIPGARAAIVGGGQGDEQAALEAQAHRLGIADRVIFTGNVTHPEALAWMRRAKILVAPLRPSGQIDRVSWCSPGKLAEYMAAGGAIAASRLDNLKDLLADQKNCLLFTPNDSQSLASTLNQLLADPSLAQRLASQAYADFPQYTFEARAQRILKFLGSFPRLSSSSP